MSCKTYRQWETLGLITTCRQFCVWPCNNFSSARLIYLSSPCNGPLYAQNGVPLPWPRDENFATRRLVLNPSTLQRGKGGGYSTTPLHRISTAQSDWLMWQLSHQTLQSQGLGQLRYYKDFKIPCQAPSLLSTLLSTLMSTWRLPGVIHMTLSPRPTPSVFAYCKRS